MDVQAASKISMNPGSENISDRKEDRDTSITEVNKTETTNKRNEDKAKLKRQDKSKQSTTRNEKPFAAVYYYLSRFL